MKKGKKTAAAWLAVSILCAVTACGGKESQKAQEPSAETEESRLPGSETAQGEEAEAVDGEAADGETAGGEAAEAGTETGDLQTTEPETADTGADASVTEDFTPVEGLSENYADLENRSFAYKGQIFTLGESTWQDLVDGGIPFQENDLNNIGNNVNSNYETNRYSVELNDYVWMQFSFVNTTQTNISEGECLLSLVRLYFLYVPQPDYEDSLNEEIANLIRDGGNYVGFSFPLTLTREQLLENNKDATEMTESNCVNYYVDSEVYMGKSGYHFEFNENTDQLEDVTISWLP